MDFFDFLILAALALPALLRWIGERSKKDTPDSQADYDYQPAESVDEPESEFERALKEISRALGGEGTAIETPPPTVPDAVYKADAQEPRPARQESEAFRREESFEREGSDRLRKASAAPFRRLKLRRIEIPVLEEPSVAPPPPRSTMLARLREPGGARNAIVFSEVLRAPLALRDPEEA